MIKVASVETFGTKGVQVLAALAPDLAGTMETLPIYVGMVWERIWTAVLALQPRYTYVCLELGDPSIVLQDGRRFELGLDDSTHATLCYLEGMTDSDRCGLKKDLEKLQKRYFEYGCMPMDAEISGTPWRFGGRQSISYDRVLDAILPSHLRQPRTALTLRIKDLVRATDGETAILKLIPQSELFYQMRRHVRESGYITSEYIVEPESERIHFNRGLHGAGDCHSNPASLPPIPPPM